MNKRTVLIFELALGRLCTSVRRRHPAMAPAYEAPKIPASETTLPRVVWQKWMVHGEDVALVRPYVLTSERVGGRGRLWSNECAGCESTEVSW
ncbi:hypothetical protein LRS74_27625 [Streptomyces sp. LX-29]|uniref:hypothetical protein n=1 Tax=Streptomyces sp. LX-29 TaxID=2900152 RepID=UPI00240D61CD|nr:hypothetical protein [Streptomyces sp. LX-29]WFB10388.1 hypothetical protein LRS74_27625 [Streptomyces sp. LX-29]